MQVLRPVGIFALSIIMLIGIIALITEFMELEEIAKIVVVPSLIFLIAVTGYCIFQSYKISNLG